jgi:hypothetical protein
MVKITTFNDRPVRHVQYMPDGTVILKLYERRASGCARHLRVSLDQWLAGRGPWWATLRRGRSQRQTSQQGKDQQDDQDQADQPAACTKDGVPAPVAVAAAQQ